MKICFVSNYKKNGYGESTRPYYISVNLLKQGHKILHLCEHDGFEGNIEYVRIETWEWEPSAIKRALNFIKLGLKVRLFNPDIIYMHQFNNARWALMTRAMPKKYFVFDAHTSVYFEAATMANDTPERIERIKNTEGDICSKSDYIICASEETKEILKTTYSLGESKLFTVGNATNMKPVDESELTGVKADPSHSFTCLATLPFDGFLSNELALTYLFEIAALVQTKTDKIKFVVTGGGGKPVPPIPNVTYTGYVADLRKEILAADICLMPYPDKAVCGGARNKFCDFIALGKVVISSPEGMRGMHALKNGETCLVAENKSDFAEKIIELFEARDKLKSLETNVLKVKGNFGWSDRALQVSEIFKKILSV
jgi:glycosyltransferase involved in cell wall biosynthesis